MNQRIIIFGNSHCACLKQAIDQNDDLVRNRFIFFASRAKRIRGLVAREGKLVPTNPKLAEAFRITSGGFDEVSFGNASAVVLVGLGLRVRPFPDVYYSSAVKVKAVRRIVRSSTLFWLAERISEVTDLPMLAFHDPFPAESGLGTGSVKSSVGYEDLLAMVNDVFSKSVRLEVLPQPARSRNGWFTWFEYTIGSKRLAVGAGNDDEEHPGSDLLHMNSNFGGLLYDSLRESNADVALPYTHI